MQYKWEWSKELIIAIAIAVVATVGQVITATDFGTKDNWDTIAEWSTWGYTLGAAVVRAVVVALMQSAALLFSRLQKATASQS